MTKYSGVKICRYLSMISLKQKSIFNKFNRASQTTMSPEICLIKYIYCEWLNNKCNRHVKSKQLLEMSAAFKTKLLSKQTYHICVFKILQVRLQLYCDVMNIFSSVERTSFFLSLKLCEEKCSKEIVAKLQPPFFFVIRKKKSLFVESD